MRNSTISDEFIQQTLAGRLHIRVDQSRGRPQVWVHVRGDLDLCNAHVVGAQVAALIGSGWTRLNLDLRQVPFCGSSALTALITARALARAHHGYLLIHNPCNSLLLMVDRLNHLDHHDGDLLDFASPGPDSPRETAGVGHPVGASRPG